MGPQKRVAFDGMALIRWPAHLFELAGLHSTTWVAGFDRTYFFYRICNMLGQFDCGLH